MRIGRLPIVALVAVFGLQLPLCAMACSSAASPGHVAVADAPTQQGATPPCHGTPAEPEPGAPVEPDGGCGDECPSAEVARAIGPALGLQTSTPSPAVAAPAVPFLRIAPPAPARDRTPPRAAPRSADILLAKSSLLL